MTQQQLAQVRTMTANETRALFPLNSPLVKFCYLAEPEGLCPLLAPTDSIAHSSWLLPRPSEKAGAAEAEPTPSRTAASLQRSQACDLLAQGSEGAVKLRLLRENIRRLDRSCAPALLGTQGNASVWCIIRKSYL